MDQDRLNHSLAVARKMIEISDNSSTNMLMAKMIEIGKNYNLTDEQLQELFVLGYIHDIGYEFGNNQNHRIIGGNILKANNYKYWQEIYYHGEIDIQYNSLYLDILNKADMQIDRYGNDVGYNKRLEDIKNRYGKDSNIYKNAEILIDNLRKNN